MRAKPATSLLTLRSGSHALMKGGSLDDGRGPLAAEGAPRPYVRELRRRVVAMIAPTVRMAMWQGIALEEHTRMWHRRLRLAGLSLVVLAVAIQFIPYGHAHSNPQASAEPAWDSPQTRALAVRACFDCHSDATTWPWYSKIAPVSWLVQNHVDSGRRALNFSEFDRTQRRADRAAQAVRDGSMPPGYYTIIHHTADLSPSEKDALIAGFIATFGDRPHGALPMHRF
jgi:hypothetical protein